MKMIIIVAIGLILPILSSCMTTQKRAQRSPLVYEDANVAIYNVCQDNPDIADMFRPLVCHQVTVQKNHTDNVNANVNLKTEPQTMSKK